MSRAALVVSMLAVGSANLMKQSLEDFDPAAVCTDGSPAAYYFQPANSNVSTFFNGTQTAASTWIVYLEGGCWCYDQNSCDKRCGSLHKLVHRKDPLCTSRHYESTIDPDGLFNPIGNDILAKANKVFVKYCTSDGHMGNGENFGFQFRGKVVVQAVLQDLVARHGLGSGADRDLMIFGGGSAGARGSMVHLDYVPEMLGDAAINVDVVGFLDSPAWVDIEPFSASFPGFQYITQQVHSYANVEHLGIECAEAYPTEQWKCMYGQYRLPTLKTRYFLVASQADQYQLSNNVGGHPSSSTELAYTQDFAALTRDLLQTVKATSAENAVFSWACYNHCVATQDSGFNGLTCSPGDTMGTALQQFLGWLPRTTSPELSWIDTCTGFACGSGCSALMTNGTARSIVV